MSNNKWEQGKEDPYNIANIISPRYQDYEVMKDIAEMFGPIPELEKRKEFQLVNFREGFVMFTTQDGETVEYKIADRTKKSLIRRERFTKNSSHYKAGIYVDAPTEAGRVRYGIPYASNTQVHFNFFHQKDMRSHSHERSIASVIHSVNAPPVVRFLPFSTFPIIAEDENKLKSGEGGREVVTLNPGILTTHSHTEDGFHFISEKRSPAIELELSDPRMRVNWRLSAPDKVYYRDVRRTLTGDRWEDITDLAPVACYTLPFK